MRSCEKLGMTCGMCGICDGITSDVKPAPKKKIDFGGLTMKQYNELYQHGHSWNAKVAIANARITMDNANETDYRIAGRIRNGRME